jgi:hypothetical protein
MMREGSDPWGTSTTVQRRFDMKTNLVTNVSRMREQIGHQSDDLPTAWG